MAQTELVLLQNAATATGNGIAIDASSYTNAQQVEIAETAGGTATVVLEGTFDGANYYAIGYYQVDATATLSRSVSAVSVTANSRHVYQLLDPYPQIRARISAVSGATVAIKAYMV